MRQSKCKRKNFPHFIDRVGVELEGGFARGRKMGGTFHQDVSVAIADTEMHGVVSVIERPAECIRTWDCPCDYCQNYIEDEMGDHEDVVTGEYVSDPLTTWGRYTRFVKKNYPDVVNDSCGMHVHASFNNFVYMSGMLECATEICEALFKAYTSWGKAELNRKEWSRLKGRLAGNNTYCKRGHNAIYITGENRYQNYEKEKYVTDDRYHWLNFVSLENHGTIEARLLPAFDTADHLIEATNILFNVYRRILSKYIKGSGVVHSAIITENNLCESSPFREVTVNHAGNAQRHMGLLGSSVFDVQQISDHGRGGIPHIGPHDNAQYPYKVKQTQTRRGLKKKIKTPPSTTSSGRLQRQEGIYGFAIEPPVFSPSSSRYTW